MINAFGDSVVSSRYGNTGGFQGGMSTRRSLFEVEVASAPCAYPCGRDHNHDWPVEGAQQYGVLSGGFAQGNMGTDSGIDMSIPLGATAQNNYSPVFVEDEPVLYQCRLCEGILRREQLAGHICPDIQALMEEQQ